MRHDLFWSSRDHERSTSKFDLGSYHGNDLSRSCCISVNASRQGKQFGTFPTYIIGHYGQKTYIIMTRYGVIRPLYVFAHNFWYKIVRDMGKVPICLPWRDALTDMQHDLLKSFPWPDLRSNFEVNLSWSRDDQNMSCRICVDASWWERLSYTIPTS